MDSKMLEELLRAIVRHYGFARVHLTLQTLKRGEDERTGEVPRKPSSGHQRSSTRARSGSKPKVTAPLYVERLDVQPDVRELLTQLAQMFEDKSFLATMADAREFCTAYGIDITSTPSRAASMPRIFRVLSSFSITDLEQIVHSTTYSGPSHLAPIADAIRRNAKHIRTGEPPAKKEPGARNENQESTSSRPNKPARPEEF